MIPHIYRVERFGTGIANEIAESAAAERPVRIGPGMNRRLATVLFSAFVVAALCSYLVYRVIGNRLGVMQPKATQVIVAATDIKLGSVLRDVDLTTADFVGSLPKAAILKKQDAIGRGVVSNLYQGEPILDSRLAAVGSGGGLAATIRQGMRACAVKVDEVVGVDLRQPLREHVERFTAVAGARDDDLAGDRDALFILDARNEPSGIGLLRMHHDGETERGGARL